MVVTGTPRVPGHSCCRKVYVATSREAELDSPPPRGTELTTTALKPGRGVAVEEGMCMQDGLAWTGDPCLPAAKSAPSIFQPREVAS